MAISARQAALTVLEKCRRSGAWSDAVLSSVIKSAELNERDAALCTKLCEGVLQNTALCDFYIDYYYTAKARKLEPKLRDILRLSVYQIAFLDRIPAHAAVSEGVSLAKKHNAKAAGLVNAVLRRVAENKQSLPEPEGKGSPEYLALRYSHPLWLCQMLIDEKDYDFTEAQLAANNDNPPSMAQVNTLRCTTEELLEILKKEGVEAQKGELRNSIELLSHGDLAQLESFQNGLFYIQDSAAKLAVARSGAARGMRVLDACAAPGGKSFAAAIQMENMGEIIACDIGEKKLGRIVSSAERLGIDIIKTAAMDAREPLAEFRESFDVVLADVPCSGIGVIRKKPDIRAKAEADISRLPEIQADILSGISSCVKPGGVILYSTCTVLERENFGVIKGFLAENPSFALEGEAETLYPHINGTDGFFICKLRKNS